MNFDEAMLAHAEWKLKLHLFLHGEGALDAASVCRDDACKLGKWLYSEGLRYSNEPAYAALRSQHAQFHRCAADVVATICDGRRAEARAMIEHGSDYDQVSSRVFESIAEMKRRVEEKTGLIMGNVMVGILVVDATLIVQSGYSQHCHALLASSVVAGRRICDLLALSPRECDQFEACMAQAFEDVLPPEVSLGMLPERVRVGARVIGVTAMPIRSTGEEVDYVLFTLEDVTRLASLEAERAEGLAMIRAVRNRHAFAQFARESALRLASLLDGHFDEVAARREVHTIKGNAGLFELHDLARHASAVEERASLTRADLEGLATLLGATVRRFEEALGFSVVEEDASVSAVDQATLGVYEQCFARAAGDAERIELFGSLLRRLRMRTVRAIMGPVEDRVALLAGRLEKSVDCAVIGDGVLVHERKVAPILQALAHAVRNAVDHGIEAPDERVSLRKSPSGRLELRFEATPEGALSLSLSDDGRGIDYAALARKAVARGLVTPVEADAMTPEELTDLVFVDGLSTAERATEVSGRGVGMSALREAARRVGGDARVLSQPGRGTTVAIVVPSAAAAAEPAHDAAASGRGPV